MADRSAIQLTVHWVAGATGGTIRTGSPDRTFGGVSIDSRSVVPGDLFVGVRGERFDGGAFAEKAIAQGAGGVLVERGQAVTVSGAAVIEVDDTTEALQRLGQAVRRASGSKVVAITGSAGKTTTKEVTSEFLEARYTVVRNPGNFNNHIGLPLSLIDLRSRPDVAVVELGMNHAGEISTLVRISEPDVRVWTNVGEAHLGFFSSIEAIADAKAEVFEGASPSTVLIANADDDRIRRRMQRFAGRTVTFGIDRGADVRATKVVDRGVGGTAADVSTPKGDFALSTPLLGRGSLANVLAAAAVACELDVPLSAIAERATHLRPAPHRGEVIRLTNGATVIDDSYNANPTATAGALDVLAHSPGAARRIAVIGEMLELGEQGLALHEEIGRRAAERRVDILFAVGGRSAAALASAAVAGGMRSANVQHFGDSGEAAEALAHVLQSGDLVLVKGSRGIRTDRVVERLRAMGAEGR